MVLLAVVQLINKLALPLGKQNHYVTDAFQRTVGVTAQETMAQTPHLGLGHLLMGEYMLPFEVVSVLILAALIGAVVIVRKETRS